MAGRRSIRIGTSFLSGSGRPLEKESACSWIARRRLPIATVAFQRKSFVVEGFVEPNECSAW
jgi:hypothetical protein